MVRCRNCSRSKAAEAIGLCVDCLRSLTEDSIDAASIHRPVRARYSLPTTAPKAHDGIPCNLCSNGCRMAPGERGYCGIRENRDGKLRALASSKTALAYMYLEPLPTNCCAAWLCPGSQERGYNLAVFFYGCNFDCLFCQNASHKRIESAPRISVEEMVQAALAPEVRCVCFFGGSPEPQLPFALEVSERVVEGSGNDKHICFEWNGCGNPELVRKAAELTIKSGGIIKFDLKAFSPNVGSALCGVRIDRSFENFSLLAGVSPHPGFLTATTLLVPNYIDGKEVSGIARFISERNPDIPYSILVFHPDFYLRDLPVTSKDQVKECYEEAKRHLRRVNIGNIHLFGLL
jgi:pyruvate formate lyase activating enzyme